MCVVSFVGDHYRDKWNPLQPYLVPQPLSPTITTGNASYSFSPTRAEFDQLKKEVEDMKSLLVKAKEYDEKNNEPNCEIEEKMEFLRQVAKLVGVDLNDVIKPKV